MSTEPHFDYSETFNQNLDGWCTAMGLRFTKVTIDEVIAELEVEPKHTQLLGIVHGGVHAGIIETITSVGAATYAANQGQVVVGLENHTSFLRAARSGRIHAVAKPLSRGRTNQVWEANIFDEQNRLIATGRVRLQCLDGQRTLAGQPIQVQIISSTKP